MRRRSSDHPRSRGVYSDSARADSLRSGSSPLARGLPNDKSPWAERPRIIPARAGFTLLYPRFGSLLTDHPRSRGVYRLEWCASPRPPGSSPLARGLRGGRSVSQVQNRIIPARAGFTPRGPRSARRGPDHPRSRGVYSSARSPCGASCGSSPLARGLRPIIRSAESRRGIIPARAGFTPCPGRGTSRRWDHPRSRGVYTHSGPSAPASTGSSPLARGLLERLRAARVRRRDHPRSRGVYWRVSRPGGLGRGSSPLARGLPLGMWVHRVGDGIIPARAGFTRRRHRDWVRRADHPRSRGVYRVSPGACRRPSGSSPLARGLRADSGGRSEVVGIIPARAGFTCGSPRIPVRAADHPRSRGVYDGRRRRRRPRAGSSPLARGLPGIPRRAVLAARIIPARAGFTSRPRLGGSRLRDHPRSRGVYMTTTRPGSPPSGSSPLARGLLGLLPGLGVVVRIIPARAGFTSPAPGERIAAADHPRSRGVYAHDGSGSSAGIGSSPLARGLPPPTYYVTHTMWIIPARAGFTGFGVHRSVPFGDHPRSRGVYMPPCQRCLRRAGSSPLARGLPERRAGGFLASGIIPARAGFTPPGLPRPGPPPDHPRSRGVYLDVPIPVERAQGSSPLARGLPRATYKELFDVRIIPARAGFTRFLRPDHGRRRDHPRSRGVYSPVRR